MKDFRYMTIAALAAVGLALAACGGGGGSSTPTATAPTPEEECTSAGGSFADGTCTTAAQLLAQKQEMQRTAITNAITAAQTAVGGIGDTSSDGAVTAAESAVNAATKAIMDAANLPTEEKNANTRAVNALKSDLSGRKMARMEAMDEAKKVELADMAKTGKALLAALGTAPLGQLDTSTTQHSLTSAGLMLTAADNALDGDDDASNDVDLPRMKASASAGSQGGWSGMNYADTNAGTKVVNEARVYNNKGPGRSRSFTQLGYTVETADDSTATPPDIKGYVTLGTPDGTAEAGRTILGRMMADAFSHSGTQNYAYSDAAGKYTTQGTYDGAPGQYRCTNTDNVCSVTNDGKGGPSLVTGTWHFMPDAGANAMAHQPDTAYLYYGWWVRKDKDGMPTNASAFTGVVGSIPGHGTTALATNPSALEGSATYAGHAAGKFALDYSKNALLDGTSDGGHFTADAELKATFGAGATAGVTGTIDNFRLNDGTEDPGWSVALHRAPWGAATAGAFATPTTDVITTTVNETMGTTWSIDGTSAPRSGTWSGQMYDEMPGNTNGNPPGDGSDVPTTATGTFHSSFSNVGTMVGAFGADKQ